MSKFIQIMLHRYSKPISHIALPERFTWPFHYRPHELSRLAAEQVQSYIAERKEWAEELSKGKMFGVLVVKDKQGELGFLAAFSGNLAGSNCHDYFVEPIYDMLQPDDFFRKEEQQISQINKQIDTLISSEEYTQAKENLDQVKTRTAEEISKLKALMQSRKEARHKARAEGGDTEQLTRESQQDNAQMQRLKKRNKELIATAQEQFDILQANIERLKRERRTRSAKLQMDLFREFRLKNALGEVVDLCEIFAPTPQAIPPAGAGECAGPKLMQYAYNNDLQPIAMAEFWWGESPKGEVRQHGNYYPACNSKCKPILTFMMQGLEVEDNPLMGIEVEEPEIIWEDEWLVAINKPHGMLSVRGKSGVRSAEEWAEERYGKGDFPMIIHRLDQSTSGILLIAKNKEAHQALQEQFIKRTLKKSYIALLDGVITQKEGVIDLPIRLDYDNRPRQMVSADGKQAITHYQLLAEENGHSRVRFYPLTGRTHQLRVHSAHKDGLGVPIMGDDIYGIPEKRLYLHAETLEFTHPRTGERIKIECRAEF